MNRGMQILLLITVAVNLCFAATDVHWISTTNTSRWIDNGLSLLQTWSSQANVMEALPDSQRQTIDGFGGCFNELEWTALGKLSASSRDSVMRNLFDTVAGCRYNMGRMPIGANDYSLSYYSHNDSAGDYDMSAFSIGRHKQYVIPFIKEAMKLRPDLNMWGSPWTVPAWMKTNNNYSGGSITWTPQNLQAYALYLEKCVRAYQAEGLNFTAVFIQNEPWSNNVYPTCLWTPSQLRDFVKLYAGPHFKNNNVPAQLWLSTINNSSFATAVAPSLDDSICRSYLTGVGYQWEGYDAMATHYQRYPQIPFWQTETKCGNGVNNWAYGEEQFNDRKNAFDRGAKAFVEWNMVLEKNGVSNWGWVQSALISIDTLAKTVTYNPQYYASKHFSYFIRPGARYIKTSGNYTDRLGFINPNGDVVLLARNSTTSTSVTAIKVDNQMFLATIPAKSFNTFVITGVRPPIVSVKRQENKSIPSIKENNVLRSKDITSMEVYDLLGKKLYSSVTIPEALLKGNIHAYLSQVLGSTSMHKGAAIVKLRGTRSTVVQRIIL